jgi:NCS1 family nucleobase:cation symporter-1
MTTPDNALRDRGLDAIEWAGLEPIAPEDRHGTARQVGVLWFAAQLVPSAVFLGLLGPQLGLGFGASLGAIVLGNLLGALGPSLLCLSGPRTGTPTLGQARAMFGGSTRLVGLLAALTSVSFIALGAVFGGQALRAAFGLPQGVGILLVFLVEAAVSVLGYEVLHRFERWSAVLGACGFLTVSAVVLAKGIDPGAIGGSGGGWGSFGLMTAITFGFAFGWAHNAPDYSRYLPATTSSTGLFLATYLGITTACVWMEALGLAAARHLEGSDAMAALYELMGGSVGGAVVMVAMFVGVAANAAVAQYSAGLQLMGVGVALPRPLVTAGVAVFAFGLTLYLVSGELTDTFSNVLLLSTYWVGPFVGVWAVTWSRRRLASVPVRPGSAQWRRRTVAGAVALVLGYLAALPFSSTTAGSDLADAGSPFAALCGSISRSVLDGADLAYPVGILAGLVIYRLLLGRDGRGRSAAAERSAYLEPTGGHA